MNKNCLTYWFPKIEAAGLPVPRTLMCAMNREVQSGLYEAFDGNPVADLSLDWIKTTLRPAAEFVGLPCFLRTGQTSGKHNWKNTCYVTNADNLLKHVLALIEFSECCDFLGLPCDKWIVREMLPTIPQLVADRYGDMPVCREFRFFVNDGRIQCWHPYWPEDALRKGMSQPPEDLEYRHRCLSYWPGVDANTLTDLASRAGAAVGGFWSVDILETARGWFVTDMAEGERSWHWPACRFAPPLSSTPSPDSGVKRQ